MQAGPAEIQANCHFPNEMCSPGLRKVPEDGVSTAALGLLHIFRMSLSKVAELVR